MSDDLDLVRAPVPVGVATGPATAHPAIDARTILAPPPRPTRPRATPRPLPPDPLGVLDTETSRVLQPTGAADRRRWPIAAIAAGIVAVAAVPAVIVALGDDGGSGSGDVVAVASAPPSTAPPGDAEVSAVMWGQAAGTCPDDPTPCYTVEVGLSGHAPGRVLHVTCEVADVPVPAAETVTADADGEATVRVACAENRAAREIVVAVDGEPAATIDLPTTIVPSPSVTFSNDRDATGQPGCSAPACRFVDVTLSGFDPSAVVTVSCVSEETGPFSDTEVTIEPDGTASDEACYFGYAGEQFWVEADGVRSPTVTWPED